MTTDELKSLLKQFKKDKVKDVVVYVAGRFPRQYKLSKLVVVADAFGVDYLTDNKELLTSSWRINKIVPGPMLILSQRCDIGSDPEFFFEKDGKVVPSIEVVTEETDRVKRDGFQGELNPRSSHCREIAGSSVARALLEANRIARQVGAQVSFQQSVVIDDETWQRAPDEIKRFGCNPTVNVHEEDFERGDGMNERFRSAGGHIHLGVTKKIKAKYMNLVKVLDIVVGNTCVLIDRDPSNARRRKIYGRAGEFRLKPYGLEYRVPSNFWLKNYKLFSMVTGLCRNAVSIIVEKKEKELFKYFDFDKVRQAINENDYELALQNFMQYKQFLTDFNVHAEQGIDVENVDKFLKWATGKDPIKQVCGRTTSIGSWSSKLNRHVSGFESFISKVK